MGAFATKEDGCSGSIACALRIRFKSGIAEVAGTVQQLMLHLRRISDKRASDIFVDAGNATVPGISEMLADAAAVEPAYPASTT